jgi:hypothetical protein
VLSEFLRKGILRAKCRGQWLSQGSVSYEKDGFNLSCKEETGKAFLTLSRPRVQHQIDDKQLKKASEMEYCAWQRKSDPRKGVSVNL